MPQIKLYGELHHDDDLLDAYHKIFMEAQRDKCKLCFLERQLKWQSDADETLKLMSNYSHDRLVASMELCKQDYKNKAAERGMLAALYIYHLCALTNIRPIAVDIAIHPVRMHLNNSAQNKHPVYSFDALRDTFAAMDIDGIASATGNSHEYVVQKFKKIKQELENEDVWWDAYHKDHALRMSQDHLIVDLILSCMTEDPAIVIFGKDHIDLKRWDSIAGILAMSENVKSIAYQISGLRISPLSQ